MVTSSPLFKGRWTWKKFGALVLDDIWPELVFLIAIATIVTCVTELTSVNLGVNNQLLTVLGLVLGLVISFRTSSAYERFQEGRKLWTGIIVHSRTLGKLIWAHVPLDRGTEERQSTEQDELDALVEKKTMISLVQAFSVSVKHFLRNEPGPYYEDLYPLIACLPRYANAAASDMAGPDVDRLPLWFIRDEQAHLFDPKQGINPALVSMIPITIPEPATPQPVSRRTASDSEKVTFEHTTAPRRDVTLVNEPEQGAVESDKATAPSSCEGMYARNSIRTRPLFSPRESRSNTFDPEKVLPQVEAEFPLRPARNPPEPSILDYIPVLRICIWFWRRILLKQQKTEAEKRREARKQLYSFDLVESQIPMEILLYLHSYTNFLTKKKYADPNVLKTFLETLIGCQDTVAQLERICNTPLPFAYQAHLRASLWLYLLLLPFQLVPLMGWTTIPATGFVAYLLLGFLEIGHEIENPFNYDLNDLDLDGFCLSIQRDLHEITAHGNHDPDDYIFTRWNQPFAPIDRRSAADIRKAGVPYQARDSISAGVAPGYDSLRRTFVSGWRNVDQSTREFKVYPSA